MKSQKILITAVFMILFVGLVKADVFEISGTVTNNSGNPFSAATVEALSGGATVASTITDSNGYYALSVNSGIYDIRVTPPTGSGFQISVLLHRSITANTTIDFVLVPANNAVTLSGRILDGNGNGIAGQNVDLNGAISFRTITDISGSYSFQVPPGNYSLLIYGFPGEDDYAPRTYNLRSNNFTLSANTQADISLPVKRVTVRVQDPNGNPVPNTSIKTGRGGSDLNVGPFSGSGDCEYPEWLPGAVTDLSGDATLWLFGNASYNFTATPPSGTPFARTTLNAAVAGDTSITLSLIPAITLSGHVYDGHGNPLANQNVDLSGAVGYKTITDSSGAYSFQVPPGNYSILIYGFPGQDNDAPRVYDVWANNFYLSANTQADLTLPVKRVIVHVQDPAGNPVPNTSINTDRPTASNLSVGPFGANGDSAYPEWLPAAVTDASGDATLWLFGNVSYNFTATAPSGTPFARTTLNAFVDGDTSITLSLIPAITLSGHVYDGNGNPLVGHNVDLSGTNSFKTITDSSGTYSFQVAPGNYSFLIYGFPGQDNIGPRVYDLWTSTFNLSANTQVDITLPVKRVTVRVQDPAGNPVPNTSINTDRPTSSSLSVGPFSGNGDSGYPTWLPAAVTDASGDVTLWLFGNAFYTFTATPPSGTPFLIFNVANISVTEDKDLVFVMQFTHTPPMTTATLTPSPDENEMYADPTTVSLSATALSGFTIQTTYYNVDGGPNQIYSAPFNVSGGGSHTIKYWSVDNAGVFELTNTTSFEIPANPTTTTTLQSSTNPSVFGQPVTFTATVAKNGGSQIPTGYVKFTDNGIDIGSMSVAPAGNNVQSSITIDSLSVGSHSVIAEYSGDSNYDSSTSASFGQMVNKANTVMTLSPTTTLVLGQPAIFTATVTVSFPGAGMPTGNVSFKENGVQIGEAVLQPTGSGFLASFTTTSTLSIGNHSITATYAGDDHFTASDAAEVTQVVVYNFNGFFQPVDNPGIGATPVYNSVKAGSAIPVKFSLSGPQGLGIMAPGYPASQACSCEDSFTDVIEQTVTAGNSSLSYDAAADQYNYVWKTDNSWVNTCRKLIVRLVDGTDHIAYFKFTK